MEFQNTQYNGFLIGVSRKVEKSLEIADERASLVNSLGPAPQNDWWLWFRYASPIDSLLPVPRDWGTATEPWVEIANGRLASKIVEAYTRIHEALKTCGVG